MGATPAFTFEHEFKQALALLQAGNRPAAGKIYDTILAQDPDNESARVNMAAIALDEDRMEAVVEHCSVVLTHNYEHPVAREVLAEANLRMADRARSPQEFGPAAQAVDDAVVLLPESAEVAQRGAAILRRLADAAVSAGAIEQAHRLRARSVIIAG